MIRLPRKYPKVVALLIIGSLAGCVTKPNPNPEIKLTESTATPFVVNPGDTVNINSAYSLKLPLSMSYVDVMESYVLKKNGEVLITSAPHTWHHSSGQYSINASIPIPGGAESGTYVVETKVQATSTSDMRQVTFLVERPKSSSPAKKSRRRR